MTNLPAQHPSLSLHLTDSTLTPLITSSSSPTHLNSLTSLASTALNSHTAVSRVKLGQPQRVMVEYPDRGAVILQSFIDPQQKEESRPGTSSHDSTSTGGCAFKTSPEDDDESSPPRLVGVVVAGSADQTKEARRAAARLEKVGRDFQKEWATEGIRHDRGEACQ